MKTEAQEQYEALTTVPERAQFLLSQQLTARIDIVDLEIVQRAYAGEFALPVTGHSEQYAIAKAESWLRKKAGVTEQ